MRHSATLAIRHHGCLLFVSLGCIFVFFDIVICAILPCLFLSASVSTHYCDNVRMFAHVLFLLPAS